MGSNERRRKRNKIQAIFLVVVLCAIPFILNAMLPDDAVSAHFVLPDGGKTETLSLEVVSTPESRSMGLMHRKDLPENRGMIFVYPKESVNKFWMKNTPLSLDMIFLNSARKVVGIVENTTPFSLESRSVAKPSQYVVELNAGRSKALGIAEGAELVTATGLPKAIK